MIQIPPDVKAEMHKDHAGARRSPIFPERGLIFVVIWKNASASLRSVIADVSNGQKLTGLGFEDHARTKVMTIPRASISACSNCTTIAIVRHPLDRFMSCYWDKSKNKIWCKRNKRPTGESLNTWIDWVCAESDTNLDPHLRTQNWFLTSNGKHINADLIRFEGLPDTALEVLKRHNFADYFYRSHVGRNRAKQKERARWQSLTYRQVRRLTKRYAVDFRRFDYRLPVTLEATDA